MISDTEQIDHSRNHLAHAVRHVGAASEHLDSWADGVEKMAGAHLAKAGHAIGAATEQHAMAKKHIDSLIGREGWDGEADLEGVKAASGNMQHELKMAGEQHAALGEAMHGGDAKGAIKVHKALRTHLDKASAHGQDAMNGIGRALEARGTADKAAKPESVIKARLYLDGDSLHLFTPILSEPLVVKFQDGSTHTFQPIEKLSDGTLIVTGFASVADYVDDQGDAITAKALNKAMSEWAPTGNIRFQHDPQRPIGTIRQPLIGKIDDGVEPPGWWMVKHPVTGTDAAVIRPHIIDEQAIKYFKSGTLTGFSVGGRVNPGGSEVREVEVDAMGRVVQEAA